MRVLAACLLALLAACEDNAEVNVHVTATGGVFGYAGIANVRRGADGRWEGHIDEMATVWVTPPTQDPMQATAAIMPVRSLVGVQPGDFIEIASTALRPLPADCTCAASSAPAVGLVQRYTSPNTGMITDVVFREARGNGEPNETFVRCSETSWDELRQTLAASDCP